MVSDYQSIFLHFFNPELGRITERLLGDADIARFTRVGAVCTAGTLIAPFGHVHEISHQSPTLLALTRGLIARGRLRLFAPSRDMSEFIESRQEMYASMKEKYQNYFSPKYKRVLSEAYSPSAPLDTTGHLKSIISDGARGLGKSNLIAASELSRIGKNVEFLINEFHSPRYAATYSSYLGSPLTPQPDESIFLGGVSTRLFTGRYKNIHSASTLTGIFYDPLLEDDEYYPYLDYRLNHRIADLLGLGQLMRDSELTRQFLELAGSDQLFHYIEMKNALIASMCSVVQAQGVRAPINYDRFKEQLALFAFKDVSRGGLDPNPTLHAERIAAAMAHRARIDRTYRVALTETEEKRLTRHSVAMFTATTLEAEILKAELLSRGFVPIGIQMAGSISYTAYGYYDTIHVLHVQSAAGAGGIHGSQNVATEFLNHFKPTMVISMGICFGVDTTKQTFGDVVVAERFSMYEPGKVEPDSFDFRGDKHPSEPRMVSYGRARRAAGGTFAVHVGPVLSGDKVVDNQAFRDSILKFDPKAQGGEMECHGLVVSCHSASIPFAMAKGICDFAAAKNDSAHEIAAQNSSSLVVDFVLASFGTK